LAQLQKTYVIHLKNMRTKKIKPNNLVLFFIFFIF
jgi:hypothetical protein